MRTNLPRGLFIILSALLCLLGVASARADGTLTHMSGAVSVQKPDGSTVPGTAGMKIITGDIVITAAGAYVRMEMADGGEMVLRPDSRLRLENYRFVEAKPAEDKFVFSMLKGGMRTVTGLIGKRGNRDAYELKTPTATIGIRGTQFDLRVCQANCGSLGDGTYLAVRFGAVQTSNALGSLPVAAGQVAHVPPQRAPVILPRNPGIGFTPPAVIPKLDEKKKQAAASAASATTPQQGQPAAAAPATSQSTQRTTSTSGATSTSTSSSASAGSDSGSSTGTSGSATSGSPGGGSSEGAASSSATNSSGAGGATTTESSNPAATSSPAAAPTSSPPAAPTTGQPSGPECSVQ